VTIEHDAAVALGDKLEIISHVHPAGSTEQFGAELADRTVRTLTYASATRRKPSPPSSPSEPRDFNSTSVLTSENPVTGQ